jgi:hypothetical protein
MTPLEELKAAYPIFTIKNKVAHSKEVTLSDGESVMIPPLGVRKILSAHLINIPNPVYFQLIDPPVSALIEAGVIKSNANTLANNE